MLNQLSWTTYLQVIIALATAYYLFILLRYYPDELKAFLKTKKVNGGQALPAVLQYDPGEAIIASHHSQQLEESEDNRPDSSLAEADSLIAEIKSCIQAASGKPFAPAILIPQITKIFRAAPGMAGSPYRPAINEIVVSECERLGTALLTEDEVDQWWDK